MTEGNAAKDLALAGTGEPAASPANAGLTEPVSRADFEALKGSVDALVKALPDLETKLKQSQRDTISDRVRKTVGESLPDLSGLNSFVEAVTPFLKEGTNPKQVSREVLMDALLHAVSQPAGATGSPQAPVQQAAKPAPNMLEAELQSIMDKHGLKGTEPELREYMTQNRGKSLRDILNGFSELAEGIAARQTDPGTILPGKTGTRAGPDVVKQYVQEMLKTKGQGYGAARAVKERFKRLGVDVDHIDLMRPGF